MSKERKVHYTEPGSYTTRCGQGKASVRTTKHPKEVTCINCSYGLSLDGVDLRKESGLLYFSDALERRKQKQVRFQVEVVLKEADLSNYEIETAIEDIRGFGSFEIKDFEWIDSDDEDWIN